MLLISLFSCKVRQLKTVDELDITKYAGTWYEIARLPNRFEKGLECVSATYQIRKDGRVSVTNSGYPKEDHNKKQEVKGVAWVPDKNQPAKLKVRFFWPFSGDYQVIALDKEYQYALVGEPKRKYLWILAKNKTMDEEIYKNLVENARSQGFDTSKLIKINQNCN